MNNSLVVGVSQLGGALAGNPNFTGGQAARIILNEVNGTNRSNLAGATEIFGNRAEYVLVNPNGITCSGCGFINTPRVTLSTGRVDMGTDGILRGFDVTRGDIKFEGLDVNATNLDSFDIISRTASFASGVYAGSELNVITGSNHVDYNTKVATPIAGAGAAPQVGLDSSALGGMYAGKINLVATEAGVGVNTQGKLGASVGDIKITADGRIEYKDANAKGDIKVTSTNNSVKHSGNSYSEGKTEINAGQAIELADGFTAAKGDVKLNSSTLDENSTASVMAGVDAVTSGTDVTFNDNGIGVLDIITTGAARNAGTMAGAKINVTSNSFTNTGLVQSPGDISITAGNISNLNNYIIDTNGNIAGGINSSGKLTLISTSGNIDNTDGALTSTGLLTITSSGLLINNSLISGGNNIVINAASVDNSGSYSLDNTGNLDKGIIASGNIDITTTTGGINNNAGTVAANNVTLTLTGSLNNSSGLIQAIHNITANTGAIDNTLTLVLNTIKGLLASGELKLNASGNIDNTGGIISGDTLDITSTGTFTNNTLVQSTHDLSIKAGIINNDNSLRVVNGNLTSGIIAGGNASLESTAGNISNFRGAITSNGIFTIKSIAAIANNNGYISAAGAGDSSITAATHLNNATGSIITDGNLKVEAASGDNRAGGVISTQNNLEIIITDNSAELKNTHGDIYAAHALVGNNINNNSGRIQGGDSVSVTGQGGVFDNTSGNILAFNTGGSVYVNSQNMLTAGALPSVLNAGGSIVGMQNVVITSGQSIDGNITTGGNVTLNIIGSLINNAIITAGDFISFIIAQGNFTNSSGAKLISGTRVEINVTNGNVTNNGEISAPDIDIDITGGSLTNSSLITSSGGIDIDVAGTITNSGRISSVDAATIDAITMNNTGQVVSDDTLAITTSGNSINNTGGGVLYATNDLILHSAVIKNIGSDIFSLDGDVRMELANGVMNTSVTNTSGNIEAMSGDVIINTNNLTNNRSSYINVQAPKTTQDLNADGIDDNGNLDENNNGIIDPAVYLVYDVAWLNNALDPNMVAARNAYYSNPNRTSDDFHYFSASGNEYFHAPRVYNWHTVWIFRVSGTNAAAGNIAAGNDINMNIGSALNDGSTINAGNNINITGGTLTNNARVMQEWTIDTRNESDWGGTLIHGVAASNNWFSRNMDVQGGGIGHPNPLGTGRVNSSIIAHGSISGSVSNIKNAEQTNGGVAPSIADDTTHTITASTSNINVAPSAVSNSQLAINSSSSGQNAAVIDALQFAQIPTGNNGLFHLNTAPGANYLIETNIAFIDQNRFLGSDYFLTRIGYTPPNGTKLLGDAFYETNLIRSAIFERTSQRYLSAGIGTDFAQMQTLFDNAVTAKTALALSVGIELSSTQIAALSSDIIWLVERDVDGQKVLAPVLYLAQATLAGISGKGAVISADNDLTLIATNDINNEGKIGAGRDASLTAGTNVTNNGGLITALRNVTLVATNGDIINSAVVNRSNVGSSLIREYASAQGTITSGANLTLTAGNNITNTASNITSGGNATLVAGNDITMNTEALRNRTETRGKHSYSLDDTTTNVASNVTVGGNLTANAGNDINVIGSNVTTTGNANLTATSGDINIASAIDSEEHIKQTSKKGMFSSSSTSSTTENMRHVSSNLNVGGDLTATSGQDVNVLASIVTSAGNADINAGNNINVASGNNYDYSHTEVKKSGISLSFDNGQMNYAKISARENMSGAQTNVASEITAGGDITATANRDITVLGSNIAANGDVNLNAGNDVHIAAADSASFNKSSNMKATNGIGFIGNENEIGIKADVNITKDMASGANHTNTSSNISAGNDVNVTTTRDTNILASNIAAGNDVNINAGRDLNIMSQTDTAENKQKHLEAEIGVKASVSQNISSALKSIGQIFTIGNPLESQQQVADAIMSGELDGNRKGVEDAAKAFNAYNSAASLGAGAVDGGVYVYGQVAGSKSSTVSTTHVVSNVTAIENITTTSTNDTKIIGANIKAGNNLAMNVGGNMDVQSVQNTTDTDGQNFAGNIQANLVKGGAISGGINVASTEAQRAWVDDQTELTGGTVVNINVGGNLNNKGAVIANVDANGVDKGNLQVAVGGQFTHSDIQDSDKSVTKGIGVSVGVNPNQDTGGVSGISLTYNDSKKEGVTRATIGDGTITVGGVEDDKGVNRDVNSVQQITFNEGMQATINVPMELIKDPKAYLKTSGENIKNNAKTAWAATAIPYTVGGILLGTTGYAYSHTVGDGKATINLNGENKTIEFERNPFAETGNAITFGHAINYFGDGGEPNLISRSYDNTRDIILGDHERAHVLQYDKQGILFIPSYFMNDGISYTNPYEQEADRAGNKAYINKYGE